MGAIYKRTFKDGITWYISYYVNGQQVREKVGRQKDGVTERQAKEALQSRSGSVVQGKFDIAQVKKYALVSKLMDQYLEYSRANKKSAERDLTSSKHLLPFFGNKRINEVTPWMIEKYKIKRKEEIKAKHPHKAERDISFASITLELAMLSNLFTKAIEWGKIEHNPVKGIKKFKAKSIERYLEQDEINRLIEACNEPVKTITITALNTGMRLREILKLKIKDIDFKNSIINIRDSKNGDNGKVPINDYLRNTLQGYLDGHKGVYVFPEIVKKDDGHRKDIRGSFQAALKKAEITNFRFHDLRHTFATHLALMGVDLYTIQKLGRWKEMKMIQRYAHLSPQHQSNAIKALDGLFKNKHVVSTQTEVVNLKDYVTN